MRGICNLVPNVKGISDNIRVRSILGRYLEHSRIFYFENSTGKQPHLYAGSADWMPRNFYRRIEAVFSIEAPELRQRIIQILLTYLKESKDARYLRANGSYTSANRSNNAAQGICAQDVFISEANRQREQQANDRAEESPVSPYAPIRCENNS